MASTTISATVRDDTRTSLGAAITYKLNREFCAQGRIPLRPAPLQRRSVDYDANVFLVGLKLQR